jgi:tRNA(adenine34) deaminase
MAGRQSAAKMSDVKAADVHFMEMAIVQARAAADAGEVPVGAVVVKNGVVIATGRNGPIGRHDPTAHAEMVALRSAAHALENYRLEGCCLYVTLEPCAMCAGAMLHARLDRVVYGAMDPKTGAAGSVVDLFSAKQLNHRTEVQGGVLQDACGEVLQTFFRERRLTEKSMAQPLREDALRTPDAHFASVQQFPWMPHYASDLAGLDGLRLHYLDVGQQPSARVFLCLHGNAMWSYAFRSMLPTWAELGIRVIAPDLIGFGKSDKPKKPTVHTVAFHKNYLQALIEKLGLKDIVLVLQGADHRVGRALIQSMPSRFSGLAIVGAPSELDDAEKRAYATPFVDQGYRAAVQAFTRMEISMATGDTGTWSGKTMTAPDTLPPGPVLATLLANEFAR